MRRPPKLKGKVIEEVVLRPFDGAREGSTRLPCTDPLIKFTDGSTLQFSVQETEIGEYGVELIYTPRKRGAGSR